ncbi:hypothetical protein AB0C12_27245 [Actinoplanes sp. NPDC048967]|uniref:hypothetical protein n=1 Tax=Actinoplanes sp. NPDC048967 TaxID=3155269 RepID=UPI0033DF544C
MSVEHEARTPLLPPRWFIRLAWSVHRGLYRIGGRRAGLWRPRAGGWGALRLTTIGRRSQIDEHLDACATRRPRETAVVVLAPRESASPAAG